MKLSCFMKINLKYFISISDIHPIKIIIVGICTKVRAIFLVTFSGRKHWTIMRNSFLFLFNFLSSMFLLVSTYIYVFVSFVYCQCMGISIILATITRKVFIVLISIMRNECVRVVCDSKNYSKC